MEKIIKLNNGVREIIDVVCSNFGANDSYKPTINNISIRLMLDVMIFFYLIENEFENFF